MSTALCLLVTRQVNLPSYRQVSPLISHLASPPESLLVNRHPLPVQVQVLFPAGIQVDSLVCNLLASRVDSRPASPAVLRLTFQAVNLRQSPVFSRPCRRAPCQHRNRRINRQVSLHRVPAANRLGCHLGFRVVIPVECRVVLPALSPRVSLQCSRAESQAFLRVASRQLSPQVNQVRIQRESRVVVPRAGPVLSLPLFHQDSRAVSRLCSHLGPRLAIPLLVHLACPAESRVESRLLSRPAHRQVYRVVIPAAIQPESPVGSLAGSPQASRVAVHRVSRQEPPVRSLLVSRLLSQVACQAVSRVVNPAATLLVSPVVNRPLRRPRTRRFYIH